MTDRCPCRQWASKYRALEPGEIIPSCHPAKSWTLGHNVNVKLSLPINPILRPSTNRPFNTPLSINSVASSLQITKQSRSNWGLQMYTVQWGKIWLTVSWSHVRIKRIVERCSKTKPLQIPRIISQQFHNVLQHRKAYYSPMVNTDKVYNNAG